MAVTSAIWSNPKFRFPDIEDGMGMSIGAPNFLTKGSKSVASCQAA